jgi:hypothetical protein
MRNAVSLEDRKSSATAALEKLETESALAQARLADDPDYLRAAASRPSKRGFQSRHLVLTADKA